MSEITTLFVQVTANSRKNEITSYSEGIVKVALTATPEKGKANLQLIQILSKAFRLPKSSIHIIQGMTSRSKKIIIEEPFEIIEEKLLKLLS